MTPEQKHYALDLASSWTTARNQAAGTYVADKLAAMLQEIVNSPEPEPVARVTVDCNGRREGVACWYCVVRRPSSAEILGGGE